MELVKFVNNDRRAMTVSLTIPGKLWPIEREVIEDFVTENVESLTGGKITSNEIKRIHIIDDDDWYEGEEDTRKLYNVNVEILIYY